VFKIGDTFLSLPHILFVRFLNETTAQVLYQAGGVSDHTGTAEEIKRLRTLYEKWAEIDMKTNDERFSGVLAKLTEAFEDKS
jgi:hypothetical protein